MTTVITREDLFKKVWERPMTKVAADYKISDVALKKICTKHRIPVPGRGYWAKKAAGKKVKQAYFRSISDPELNRIVIYGSPMNALPEPVRQARKEAQKQHVILEDKLSKDSASSPSHPLVDRTRKKLENAKATAMGLVSVSGERFFDVEVAPENIQRAVKFLNVLVSAANIRGHQIAKGESALVFQVNGETITFKLEEEVARTTHMPTEAEAAALKRWEERRKRHWQSVSWEQRPVPPEWDYEPQGKLRVWIDQRSWSFDGIRRKFADGKTQTIESLLNPILEGLVICAAAIKAEREDREKRKQEQEEAQRKYEANQRRIGLEKKRVEALDESIARWRHQIEVLAFVRVVEDKLARGGYQNPEPVKNWVLWAKEYADRLDPVRDQLPVLLDYDDFETWSCGKNLAWNGS